MLSLSTWKVGEDNSKTQDGGQLSLGQTLLLYTTSPTWEYSRAEGEEAYKILSICKVISHYLPSPYFLFRQQSAACPMLPPWQDQGRGEQAGSKVITKMNENKRCKGGLAHMAQFIGASSLDQKSTGSIPCQGTYPGCGSDHQLHKKVTNLCFSPASVCVCLSVSPSLFI